MQKNKISLFDRIVSAISYITAGWGGLIYTVIMFLAKKKINRFTRFNIFQSIMISALFFFVSIILGFCLKILSYIPFISYIVVQLTFLLNKPFIGDYSFIQTIITGFILYMTTFSLLGKYPRIYWVSSLIDRH